MIRSFAWKADVAEFCQGGTVGCVLITATTPAGETYKKIVHVYLADSELDRFTDHLVAYKE